MITKENQAKMQIARKAKGTLSDEFIYEDFLYERIKDTEGKLKPGFYIYMVNKSWYEVFYTTKNKMPSDEDFGFTAYCCQSLDRAWKCLSVLEKKIELKQNKSKKNLK